MNCMEGLIERVKEDFERFGVREGAVDRFMPYILALQNKDKDTFEHSIRVAYLSKKIAEFTNIAPKKTLWLPGLVHDVGKLVVDPDLLTKKAFDEKDMQKMKRHIEYGCELLLNGMEFSAMVLFYHHFFKPNAPYPRQEDFNRIFGDRVQRFTEGTRTLAKYCGRLVSVADVYDAITTRTNDRNSLGTLRLPTKEEARDILIRENNDQEHLIARLYERGIFGGDVWACLGE